MKVALLACLSLLLLPMYWCIDQSIDGFDDFRLATTTRGQLSGLCRNGLLGTVGMGYGAGLLIGASVGLAEAVDFLLQLF